MRLPRAADVPGFLRDKLGFLQRSARDCEGEVVPLELLRRTFLLTHPRDIEHVLESRADNYTKSRRFTSERGRRIHGNGMLTSTGRRHAELRTIVAAAILSVSKSWLTPTVKARVDQLAARWRSGSCAGDAAYPGCVDLGHDMSALARQIALDLIFGTQWTSRLPGLDAAVESRRERLGRMFDSINPLATHWPVGARRRFNSMDAYLRAAIINIVRESRASAQTPDQATVLYLLAHARFADGNFLSESAILDEALTLSVATYETSAPTLAWGCYMAAFHRDDAECLAAEADAAMSDTTNGSMSRYPRAMAFLHETIRLYPPTWLFIRVAIESDELPSGARIPGGATLYLSPFVSHRNAYYFRQPQKFVPERFARGTGEWSAPRPRYSYFPFGGGAHGCVGNAMALTECVMILAEVARLFTLTPVAATPVEPAPGMALQPASPLLVHVHSRAV